jgi:predicted MFS family arabinose efflux permease
VTTRSGDLRNYAVVTGAYWADTIADGASRMLVLFYFYERGYTPIEVATLFLLYEVFGIVTNLVGGFVAARFGLRSTLLGGLGTQLLALSMLAFAPEAWLVVTYVMAAQALSGVAKDLTKMSSKSAVKLVVAEDQPGALYRWVAILTGSKNALKGVGFFIGGFLLAAIGFAPALWLMAGCLAVILAAAVLVLPKGMGVAKAKAKFSTILSKSRAINMLSASRVFLFGARDVWFVVGLPVFLYDVLGWSFTEVGGFLALWVIGYGFVQGFAPNLVSRSADGRTGEIRSAQVWVFGLAAVTGAIAGALHAGLDPALTLIVGLAIFGFFFAVNSSVHSYLILALTSSDQVALNVGFYYMANAAGRLGGTLLSGIAYQVAGIMGCLVTAAVLLVISGFFALALGPAAREDLGGAQGAPGTTG